MSEWNCGTGVFQALNRFGRACKAYDYKSARFSRHDVTQPGLPGCQGEQKLWLWWVYLNVIIWCNICRCSLQINIEYIYKNRKLLGVFFDGFLYIMNRRTDDWCKARDRKQRMRCKENEYEMNLGDLLVHRCKHTSASSTGWTFGNYLTNLINWIGTQSSQGWD